MSPALHQAEPPRLTNCVYYPGEDWGKEERQFLKATRLPQETPKGFPRA